MDFEWDEEKRRANIEKHGVDFRLAAAIFMGPVLEAEDERADYREARLRALGRYRDEYFVVVYTLRGGNRRLISAWKAGRNERQKYQAIFPG